MRKAEIITELPTLPDISENNKYILNTFRNTWYKAIDLAKKIYGIEKRKNKILY